MIIVFTNRFADTALDHPQPAAAAVPEWYKHTQSFVVRHASDDDAHALATIKRCVPVLDAMTAGYIIVLPADVYVSQRGGQPDYEWASPGLVKFHPIEQAPEHPLHNGFAYPKWMNPWSIRTPDGYSALFVQPFHRESIFTILPGIVDTDTYFAPVNFPFVLNDVAFEGLIPKGTPIAQVIPFKRESWTMAIGDAQEFVDLHKVTGQLATKAVDRYKSMFWMRKDYK